MSARLARVRTRTLIMLATAFAAAGCAGAPTRDAPIVAMTTPEDTILAAALRTLAPPHGPVVVLDSIEAHYPNAAAALADSLTTQRLFGPLLPAPAWQAWRVANAVGARPGLPPHLDADRPLRRVGLTGHNSLAERYLLSRVGFTAGQDSALVEVSRVCGARCGHGALLLFVRDRQGAWQVDRRVLDIMY